MTEEDEIGFVPLEEATEIVIRISEKALKDAGKHGYAYALGKFQAYAEIEIWNLLKQIEQLRR